MTTPDTQNNDHLAKRVLKRIAGEHLTPRPRWEFLFKNYFFWALGALAVALGALAVAAELFEVANADWSLLVMTQSGFLASFLEAIPVFWAIVLALFILVGYLNVRRTNHGYRYPLAVIAIGAVLTSLVLGTGLYMVNFGRLIEEAVDQHTPFHRPILRHLRDFHRGSELVP